MVKENGEKLIMEEDFHGGPVVGSLPISAEEMGLILGLG